MSSVTRPASATLGRRRSAGVGGPAISEWPCRSDCWYSFCGSASGYLQAWLHFCAGFGSAGVYNFGPLGKVERVDDPQARHRDRIRSLQIGLASLGIGLAVGIGATLLPVR